jgi:hypothetical protein
MLNQILEGETILMTFILISLIQSCEAVEVEACLLATLVREDLSILLEVATEAASETPSVVVAVAQEDFSLD